MMTGMMTDVTTCYGAHCNRDSGVTVMMTVMLTVMVVIVLLIR